VFGSAPFDSGGTLADNSDRVRQADAVTFGGGGHRP
jgi:hypothetical protein